MAQTGYTPILIYSSSTTTNAPLAANLTNSTLGSELAINITDGKLFYKDNSNVVQVIGWKTTPTTAGGTGLTSYTVGDLLYYSTGTTLSKLNIGTAFYMLGVNAGATAPSWQPSSTSTLTTQGDLLYASAANVLARLAKNTTATRYLSNTGASNNPAWAQIDLTNGVTGTLPVGNGGTGVATLTGVVYGNGASAFTAATGSQIASAIGSTAVTNATNATNVGITRDTTTSYGYLAWSASASGNNNLRVTDATLYWVPGSNRFYATNVWGTSALMQGNGSIYTVQWQADGGSALIDFVNSSGTSLWTVGGGVTIRQDELSFRHQGTTVLYLQNDNAVKFPNISTTASAANAFLDSGNSNNILRSTSSIRYKKDVEDIDPQFTANIFNLRPIWYRSLAQADNPNWSWYGLLAEDVAKTEPRLVQWGYFPEDYEDYEEEVQTSAKDHFGLPIQIVEKQTRQRLIQGAQLKPTGVQYERLSVLMLAELTKLREEFDAYKASHP
jgi:hypothetical protein